MYYYIYLSICKILFGEFSSKYYFLADSISKKNPHLGLSLKKCLSNEVIHQFENLIIQNKTFPTYTTTKPIQMDEIGFGLDKKNIIRIKGKFSCVNYFQVEENKLEIIGYRDKILNTSVKVLFYLCKGKYFMSEYIIGNYKNNIAVQLAKTILKRYGIEIATDQPEFYIEDEFGSVLCFYNNGFNLFVKYFNPTTCHFYEKLQIIFQRKFINNQPQIINS